MVEPTQVVLLIPFEPDPAVGRNSSLIRVGAVWHAPDVMRLGVSPSRGAIVVPRAGLLGMSEQLAARTTAATMETILVS